MQKVKYASTHFVNLVIHASRSLTTYIARRLTTYIARRLTYFKHLEIFGHVSLVQYMLNLNIDRPFIVIQMRSNHFFDYQALTKQYTNSDSKMPYKKVKQLKYLINNNKCFIYFPTSFMDGSTCSMMLL